MYRKQIPVHPMSLPSAIALTFKLAVTDQVKKDQLTYKQAQRHYGIQSQNSPHHIPEPYFHHICNLNQYCRA